MFNARSETVDTKPAFRDSFRGRRCLVPATGFYEWKTVGDKKAPHYFTDAGCEGFAFAGLWDLWQGQSGDILSCTVLVCPPNEVVAPFHDRMPVILPESDYKAWLEPKEGAASLRRLLSPYPAERMRVWPVSPAVGNPRNDSPSLIEPLPIID
jgi:putative SOS response-associated peptidase YedK